MNMNRKECDYEENHCFSTPVTTEALSYGKSSTTGGTENDRQLVRCEYFSNRTRIRCSSVRIASDLNSFGYCEKHSGYIERIKSDALRARNILDPGFLKNETDSTKSSRFFSENFDETLNETDQVWPYIYESLYCDARIDDPDNPLRNAGVLTRKELVREYMSAVERQKEAIKELRIIYAEKYRRILTEFLKSEANAAKDEKKEKSAVDQKDKRLLAEFKANKKYGSYARWRKTSYFLEKIEKKNGDINNKTSACVDVLSPSTLSSTLKTISDSSLVKNVSKKVVIDTKCQHIERINHGKPKLPLFLSVDMVDGAALSDDKIINKLLEDIVGYVDSCSHSLDVIEEKMCNRNRVPLMDYCAKHVLNDSKQIFYEKCADCENPAVPLIGLKKCRQHCGKAALGPSVRYPTTRNVSINDDLESEFFVKLCVDHVKAEMEHQQQQQNHSQQQQNTSARTSLNTNFLLQGPNGHHLQPANINHHVPQLLMEPGTSNNKAIKPTPAAVDTETCARVRQFVGNPKNNGNSNARRNSISSISPNHFSFQREPMSLAPPSQSTILRRQTQMHNRTQSYGGPLSPPQYVRIYNGSGAPPLIKMPRRSGGPTLYVNSSVPYHVGHSPYPTAPKNRHSPYSLPPVYYKPVEKLQNVQRKKE